MLSLSKYGDRADASFFKRSLVWVSATADAGREDGVAMASRSVIANLPVPWRSCGAVGRRSWRIESIT